MTRLMQRVRSVAPAAAWSALLALGSAGAAYAQQGNPPGAAPPPPQQQPQAQEVSDEQLRQFVEAAGEVQSVQEEYAQQIQSTQEADEAQTLRQEAQEKMVSAVEDSGLSVSEYNLIAQRLQQDQSLAERLQEVQTQ